MLTRKQSWVIPCIESKTLPVLQDYYKIQMHYKKLSKVDEDAQYLSLTHALFQRADFKRWYYAPTELEEWVGDRRDITRYQWRKKHKFIREIRRTFNTNSAGELLSKIFF